MQRILIPIVLLVLLFGGASYYFLNHQDRILPTPLPEGHVCEPDSLVCSDGTVLKREGPKCDFPPCPGGNASSSASSQEMMPSSSPQASGIKITVSGVMICLPHKNSSGPQTMECALGMKGDDGNNYALSDPGWKYLMGVGNGAKVEVTGSLVKKNDGKYDSAGVIEIETLVKK